MKFLFLGTGAADWPRDTAYLGDAAGTDRRCTSVLVNEDLLIDPNPDVPQAMQTFGADMRKIKYVIISHSHGDHYSAETLTRIAVDHVIHVYGSAGYPNKIPDHPNVVFHPIPLLKEESFGEYTIFPVYSTHYVDDTLETCYHYVIKTAEKTVFYGCDGAWLAPEAFQPMEKYGHYDCMIMDATFGDDPMKYRIQGSHIYFYHNSVSMLATMKDAFTVKKMVDDTTVMVADHLAKTYFPDIESAREQFGAIGFVPTYDGMRLEI